MSGLVEHDFGCPKRHDKASAAERDGMEGKTFCYWALLSGTALSYGGFYSCVSYLGEKLPKARAVFGFVAGTVGVSVSAAAVLNLLFIRNAPRVQIPYGIIRQENNSNTEAVPSAPATMDVPVSVGTQKSCKAGTELKTDGRKAKDSIRNSNALQQMEEVIQECDSHQPLAKVIKSNAPLTSARPENFSSTLETAPLNPERTMDEISRAALYKQFFSALLNYGSVQDQGHSNDEKFKGALELFRQLNLLIDDVSKSFSDFPVDNEFSIPSAELETSEDLCDRKGSEAVDAPSSGPLELNDFLAADLLAVCPKRYGEKEIESVTERIEKLLEEGECRIIEGITAKVEKFLARTREEKDVDSDARNSSFSSSDETTRTNKGPVIIVLNEKLKEDLVTHFQRNCKFMTEVKLPGASRPCALKDRESNPFLKPLLSKLLKSVNEKDANKGVSHDLEEFPTIFVSPSWESEYKPILEAIVKASEKKSSSECSVENKIAIDNKLVIESSITGKAEE